KMNCDDDIGTHLPDHIGRQVADQAAIDQDLVALAHRPEDAGNRHAGAHGLRQAAVAENDFFSTDKIGGDAAVGNRQVVERLQVRVGEQFAVNQQADLVTGIQSRRQGKASLEAKLNEGGIVAKILFAAGGKKLVGGLGPADVMHLLSAA